MQNKAEEKEMEEPTVNSETTEETDKEKEPQEPPTTDAPQKEDEDIITELIKLYQFKREEIVSAMQTVVNKHDINAIVEHITQNQSKSQLKDIKQETESKEEKKEKEEERFPVSVYIRMRPLVGDEVTNNHAAVDYAVKSVKKRKTQSLTMKKCAGKDGKRDKKYSNFAGVIEPKYDNLYTYSHAIYPSIQDVFDGVSTCAFAYGHTGSGKTHTIFGYDAEAGMYRLFAQELCSRVRALNNDTFIEIRFTELYQGIVRDLLSAEKTECFLREDMKGNVHLRGQTMKYDDGRVIVKPITSFHVKDAEEVDKYIQEGMASRNVGKSTLHDKSSRSHAFLEFELVHQKLVDARLELPEVEAEHDAYKRKFDVVKAGTSGNKSKLPKMQKKMDRLKARIKTLKKIIKQSVNDEERPYIAGNFVFVDLAGNEYGRDVKSKDKQEEKERNAINASLFALKECIRGLHNKGKKRVPYRGSKLTMYLRRYLAGEGSKAIMISNIGISKEYTKQTINTLQYCQLVAKA
eukprot:363967_1